MKKRNIPRQLEIGDRIGLITPSSSATEEKIEKAVRNMQRLGFKVTLGKHVRKKHGFLAGTDEQRLEDLHEMFADPNIDGIWCIRGGYGVGRILPHIDYKLIKNNPKVLIGYSDVTALLHAIHLKTGLICFHGPVASSDFTDYTMAHLKNILMYPRESFVINSANVNNDEKDEAYRPQVIRAGKAKGKLTGGNLTLLSSIAGTKFKWKVKNKIVFLEDIGERPYRIDRMLTQLLQSTDLHKAAGIILGVFEDCQPKGSSPSLSLMETFQDRLGNLGMPVGYGYSFGHIKNHFTIPLGMEAEMNTEDFSLKIKKEAVVAPDP